MTASTTTTLSKAFDARLIEGALPGELEGFAPADRAAAAVFMAEAAARRLPGTPAIVLEALAGDTPTRRMRLAVINDDMPFLVDSIAATIAKHDVAVDRIIHPLLPVTRDARGALVSIGEGPRESWVYIELRRADARARRAIETELVRNLAHVRSAVTDWSALKAAMQRDAAILRDGANGEAAALLDWFRGGAMTLLGHHIWRDGAGETEDALGIARHRFDVPLLAEASHVLALDWFRRGGAGPLLLKSNCISTVHRRAPLDLVVLPVREGGEVVGLSLHAGLWTSAALGTSPTEVPMLRERLRAIEVKYGFDPKSHAGKALTHALGALPHDLTTAFQPDALDALVLTAMSLADRPRPKLAMVKSTLGRHRFAFVWLPRDEVTTARRIAIGEMLASAADANILNWSIALEGGMVALIRYTLDVRGSAREPDVPALDDAIERMVRGWASAIETALAADVGDARATRLTLKFANCFPSSYRITASPEEAARDIVRIADLADANARSVRISHDAAHPGEMRVKLYRLGGPLPLSDAVPVFENFGFRVIEEVPTALTDDARGYVHDFGVTLVGGTLRGDLTTLEQAIDAVLEGRAENDAFNRLIVEAGMAPPAVTLLRAWFRYLRQTGMSYGLVTVVDALRRAPEVATAIVARFAAAHDPARAGDTAALAAADATIDAGLVKVAAIDDDRILRAIRAVVAATLRTNAFAPAGETALAFKLDSALVPGLPKPLPWREIWVYSPRVEGIHLRAGPVARGGLRWSDRRDDFRTEILGLMKAQRVKNAVIVPTGAKGGFYPKALPSPSDRDAWLAEGTESYRVFIRTLLSITDNIVDGKVVHPEGVTVRDGEDPYFVVAADKGTATFSDVANALAIERDFWLGDAFASGGSVGYDHKAMGITARGGWVSVQRHFAEMGVDVQTQAITVVGCGDMSGDVFGNGMLLSKAIKLVAAFDHRHIFLDPNPDPAASWDERDRLFALPRSSWADYDKALISDGGGVFARTDKTIALSPQAATALGIAPGDYEPAQLISEILTSPADLIWFGGIGTYVKAAAENNIQVGDPANDRLRVDAEALRARAIGEGANLGVTQAARIAFAAKGGRINTDFIDNSAGVDCSDNEVNIKIALNREMKEGRLSYEDRNALLASMTDDVAHLVLEDNRLQTLALSTMENDGAIAVPSYVRVIEMLEASGRLDRQVEGLAPNVELLRRAQEGQGLTRPELAVLLATAKLAMQDAVEARGLGDDPTLRTDLHAAFPTAMQARFPDAIDQHRLRPQIVATKLANRLINRIGVLHPFELAEEEGVAMGEIAAMFVAAERIFHLPELWAEIEAADIPEGARIALFDEVAAGTRAQIADLLRAVQPGEGPGEVVARLSAGVDALDRQSKELLKDEARAESDRIAMLLEAAGAPKPLVAKVVRLFELDGAIGLADLAQRRGVDETGLTQAFTHLGQALGLDWAQTVSARIATGDPWERLLIAGLARDFQQLRLDFLARLDAKDPDAAVVDWLDANRARVNQFADLIRRARMAAVPNAAMLAQIAGQARVLLGR